jgi:hypothetical protein
MFIWTYRTGSNRNLKKKKKKNWTIVLFIKYQRYKIDEKNDDGSYNTYGREETQTEV